MPKPKKSRSTMPSPPSSPSKPDARVWAWDKSQERMRSERTEKSAPSSYIEVYSGTSAWLVSQRASIVIQSTLKASRGCGLSVCISDSETGQTLSLPGTEVQMAIGDGLPVITVSDA